MLEFSVVHLILELTQFSIDLKMMLFLLILVVIDYNVFEEKNNLVEFVVVVGLNDLSRLVMKQFVVLIELFEKCIQNSSVDVVLVIEAQSFVLLIIHLSIKLKKLEGKVILIKNNVLLQHLIESLNFEYLFELLLIHSLKIIQLSLPIIIMKCIKNTTS